MNGSKRQILDLARANQEVSVSLLAISGGMNPVTARQYLSSLAREKELVRIGKGIYALPQKQTFSYIPSEKARSIYEGLKAELPFTDFCVYDGSILSSIQHHLSINNAIYVETNRDVVESVFARLKENNKDEGLLQRKYL